MVEAAALLVVEAWSPRLEEVGEAEDEVAHFDDEVGAYGGVRRALQNREEQLQVLFAELGAGGSGQYDIKFAFTVIQSYIADRSLT